MVRPMLCLEGESPGRSSACRCSAFKPDLIAIANSTPAKIESQISNQILYHL